MSIDISSGPTGPAKMAKTAISATARAQERLPARFSTVRSATPASPRLRTVLNLAGSLSWALAVAEIAVFAIFAGPVGPLLMSMDIAVAVACLFFTSPWLLGLLFTFPLVATAPVLVLVLRGDAPAAAGAACAIAFAMTLCMIMNRILRRQFALAEEREELIGQRASSLESAERMAKSKSQILATLSHEIRNGLSGVTHVLSAAASGGGEHVCDARQTVPDLV